MRDMEVRIGGERMVRFRGGSLVRADLEISAAAEHYRRASEFLATQAERGRAPWMVERAGSYALPEGITGRPWTGANAIWLGAAADRRGYSDPRWGTAEEIAQEGGLVRAGERETTALHWRFGGQDPRTGDSWETRVFRNARLQRRAVRGPSVPRPQRHRLEPPPSGREDPGRPRDRCLGLRQRALRPRAGRGRTASLTGAWTEGESPLQ